MLSQKKEIKKEPKFEEMKKINMIRKKGREKQASKKESKYLMN